MTVLWGILYYTNNISIIMFISGLVVFYYYGYVCWYKDYYKIKKVYPDMGRDWGPRPLLLIYGFHIVMSIEFFISLFLK